EGAAAVRPSAEGGGGLAGTARYRDPRFDQEHNAVWGRTLAEAADSIEEEVRSHGADLLCVLLGVNDLLWPVPAAEMERRLRSYAAAARRGNPDLRIAAAESPPIALAGADPAFALRLRGYNALVRGVAADLCTDRSPVVSLSVADREGWDPAADTRDGTHPSARGEVKIAAAFADTLSEEFGMGPAHPRPLTSPD
ncbi:GDSL-type esterase/lipase family protein, partial [Nocardiopsis sp. LOL_012]|uniref:GDSL-type esterase/lipase family protein n=1 Tax=Nocardiopsis sp. LOL_012 TaxID=3345409 RepID=UPI003A847361